VRTGIVRSFLAGPHLAYVRGFGNPDKSHDES
jgi:hypothetical protein